MRKHHQYRHGHGSDAQHKQDQALFSHLLEHHQKIERHTEILENGICSRTTSSDPKIAEIIQQHVEGMEKRFGMGRAIRSWDPLFAALFEYKDDITMQYHNITDGVEAILTTENPKLIDLIQCHDETLHGFVNHGFTAGGKESPKPDWLD